MVRRIWATIRGGMYVVCGLFLAGCTSSPGSPLSLSPERHKMIPSAKEARKAAPTPMPLPRELDKRLAPLYVVEPGDILLVQPANLDSPVRLPGDQPILADGTINLGRYGRVLVAGRTLEEIEQMVRAYIEAETKDVGPITARVVSRQSKIFYVLGEVNAPGAFPLSGRETVLDAIVSAGGLTDRASTRKITLSRPTPPEGCRVVLPICYDEIVQVGDTATNYQLFAGDRIYVASKSFWEDIFHFHKACPPCGGPQIPCTLMSPDSGQCCSDYWSTGQAAATPRYQVVPASVVPPSRGK